MNYAELIEDFNSLKDTVYSELTKEKYHIGKMESLKKVFYSLYNMKILKEEKMTKLVKFNLSIRRGLVDPKGQVFLPPFKKKISEDVFFLWVSNTGLTATVAVKPGLGWEALPVVIENRPFIGRATDELSSGDKVIFISKNGYAYTTKVEETPWGWGLVEGVKIPLWRDGWATHPSGLKVNRYNEFYLPSQPSHSESEEPKDEDL